MGFILELQGMAVSNTERDHCCTCCSCGFVNFSR